MTPKVSIIMPCYNYGRFIDQSLGSLYQQTFQDFEIIIVNDGSNDEFTNKHLETLENTKIRYYKQKNHGVAKTRNFAIKESKGELILPLDPDDYLSPDFIEKCVELFESSNDKLIVIGATQHFEARTDKVIPEYKFPDILMSNVIPNSAMYRKSEFEKTGGYNPTLAAYEDYEFYLSLIQNGNTVKVIPEVTYYYRIHQKSRNTQAIENVEKSIRLHNEIVQLHLEMYRENVEFFTDNYFKMWHHMNAQIKDLEAKLYDNRPSNLPFKIYRKLKKILNSK